MCADGVRRQEQVFGDPGPAHPVCQALQHLGTQCQVQVHYPRPEFCTDNAAMIAYAGCQRLMAGEHEDLRVRAQARWPLDTLRAVG